MYTVEAYVSVVNNGFQLEFSNGDLCGGSPQFVQDFILDEVCRRAIDRPEDGLPSVRLVLLRGHWSDVQCLVDSLSSFGISTRVEIPTDWPLD